MPGRAGLAAGDGTRSGAERRLRARAKKLSQKGEGLIPTHPPTGSLASGGTSLRQAQGRLPRLLASPDSSGSGLPGRDFEIVTKVACADWLQSAQASDALPSDGNPQPRADRLETVQVFLIRPLLVRARDLQNKGYIAERRVAHEHLEPRDPYVAVSDVLVAVDS